MRWTKETEPKGGDKRSRYKFAWKPFRIGNTFVWLESYVIEETYFKPVGGGPGWWSASYSLPESTMI